MQMEVWPYCKDDELAENDCHSVTMLDFDVTVPEILCRVLVSLFMVDLVVI